MDDFVTLEEVKDHLRIDGDDADGDLEIKISAATERILLYLNGRSPRVPVLDDDRAPVLDDDGNPTYGDEIRPTVRAATLLLVGYMYRYPSGDEKKAFDAGVLPGSVTALLAPLRKPALA